MSVSYTRIMDISAAHSSGVFYLTTRPPHAQRYLCKILFINNYYGLWVFRLFPLSSAHIFSHPPHVAVHTNNVIGVESKIKTSPPPSRYAVYLCKLLAKHSPSPFHVFESAEAKLRSARFLNFFFLSLSLSQSTRFRFGKIIFSSISRNDYLKKKNNQINIEKFKRRKTMGNTSVFRQ